MRSGRPGEVLACYRLSPDVLRCPLLSRSEAGSSSAIDKDRTEVPLSPARHGCQDLSPAWCSRAVLEMYPGRQVVNWCLKSRICFTKVLTELCETGGWGGWRCPLFQEHSPRQVYHALCTLSFLPMGPVSPEPRVNGARGCLLTQRLLSAHTFRRILITK